MTNQAPVPHPPPPRRPVTGVDAAEPEPVNPSMVSLRMLLDDDPVTSEHGDLPDLVWQEQGWRNDRPGRFGRALRHAWRRV